jgi:hypothetical protein
MALPKKYWKKYPGNLKKAWAAFRADSKTKKSSRKKIVSKKRTITTKGAATMPKKKRNYKAAAKKAAAKIRYRTKEVKPVQMLIRALIAAAGGITTSVAVNKAPFVKGLDPKLKSGAQMAAGLAALYLLPKKFDFLKYLGVGAFTAGTFGLVQKISQLEVLAGDAELSEQEIQALLSAGYLSGPAEMGRLSGPADLGRNPAFMGYGEAPQLMGDSFQID